MLIESSSRTVVDNFFIDKDEDMEFLLALAVVFSWLSSSFSLESYLILFRLSLVIITLFFPGVSVFSYSILLKRWLPLPMPFVLAVRSCAGETALQKGRVMVLIG